MIRAEAGTLFPAFKEREVVAIGWYEVGDLTNARSPQEIRDLYIASFPAAKPGKINGEVAMLAKFRFQIAPGDTVITYNPETRVYLVGVVIGEYKFDPNIIGEEYPHARAVTWEKEVGRDSLSAQVRNTLGGTLTLFSLTEEVLRELRAGGLETSPGIASAEEQVVIEQEREDIQGRSRELIKDRIS